VSSLHVPVHVAFTGGFFVGVAVGCFVAVAVGGRLVGVLVGFTVALGQGTQQCAPELEHVPIPGQEFVYALQSSSLQLPLQLAFGVGFFVGVIDVFGPVHEQHFASVLPSVHVFCVVPVH